MMRVSHGTFIATLLLMVASAAAVASPKHGPVKVRTHSSVRHVSGRHAKVLHAATSHSAGHHEVIARHEAAAVVMPSERATQIQTALIKQGYLSGEPSGSWDPQTVSAMQKLQSDNGWQSKVTPDSRALIKLGLGPGQTQDTAQNSPQ